MKLLRTAAAVFLFFSGCMPAEALTISDNFDRTSSDTLFGPGCGNWTETLGDLDISFAAVVVGEVNTDNLARLECDLGTPNHYAQIVVVDLDALAAAFVAARYNPAANTAYVAVIRDAGATNTVQLLKVVGGSWIQLGSSVTGLADSFPATLRIEVDGTNTIKVIWDGEELISFTDASSPITGNLRTGMGGYLDPISGALDVVLDDFQAGDFEVGAASVRGRMRIR
jgi:hypothetical protein